MDDEAYVIAVVAAGERVLVGLRDVAADLPPLERSVLGALLAPGIAAVYQRDADVSGFGLVHWAPDGLPQALAEVVSARRGELPHD